jgi:hypothetical protein
VNKFCLFYENTTQAPLASVRRSALTSVHWTDVSLLCRVAPYPLAHGLSWKLSTGRSTMGRAGLAPM